MRTALALAVLPLIASCSGPGPGIEPSLAPRAAESIDPRVPIPDSVPVGPVDPALAARLAALRSEALAGEPRFNALAAEATRLAASAGPVSSESWIAAQQALSRLTEHYGVTTRAAAEIDALGATRLESRRWITPADQRAISEAALAVGAVNDSQAMIIRQLSDQLSR